MNKKKAAAAAMKKRIVLSVGFDDPKEKERVESAAKAVGMKVSEFIRHAAKLYADEVRRTGKARAAA